MNTELTEENYQALSVFPFAKQFLCFCNTHKGIFIY